VSVILEVIQSEELFYGCLCTAALCEQWHQCCDHSRIKILQDFVTVGISCVADDERATYSVGRHDVSLCNTAQFAR